MIHILLSQIIVFITVLWVITRCAVALKTKQFTLKRELQMLLVYVCIVVISRFVYCGFHLVNGRIPALKIGISPDLGSMISCKPFFFLVDRYEGWLMNIIGNITMFIPVGIVWPICFRNIDSIKKDVLAGGGTNFI